MKKKAVIIFSHEATMIHGKLDDPVQDAFNQASLTRTPFEFPKSASPLSRARLPQSSYNVPPAIFFFLFFYCRLRAARGAHEDC